MDEQGLDRIADEDKKNGGPQHRVIFDDLRGIAKGLFAPGEWEASIRADRENFFGDNDPHLRNDREKP